MEVNTVVDVEFISFIIILSDLKQTVNKLLHVLLVETGLFGGRVLGLGCGGWRSGFGDRESGFRDRRNMNFCIFFD